MRGTPVLARTGRAVALRVVPPTLSISAAAGLPPMAIVTVAWTSCSLYEAGKLSVYCAATLSAPEPRCQCLVLRPDKSPAARAPAPAGTPDTAPSPTPTSQCWERITRHEHEKDPGPPASQRLV
jgi:hypothetical protein